jgi:hypothetical protein
MLRGKKMRVESKDVCMCSDEGKEDEVEYVVIDG